MKKLTNISKIDLAKETLKAIYECDKNNTIIETYIDYINNLDQNKEDNYSYFKTTYNDETVYVFMGDLPEVISEEEMFIRVICNEDFIEELLKEGAL